MFPMRTSPPKKSRSFHCTWDFWAEYRDLAVQFQHEITSASKVYIVLGREDWELVCKDIEKDREGLVVTRVALSDSVDYYERRAQLLVVRDTQRVIKQIILPSYHLEWIFRAERTDRNLEMARMMDVVWNFAAAVCGMDTVHSTYFEWKVGQSVKEVKNDWPNMKGNDLWRARVMLGWEKANGPIDKQVVAEVFSSWLEFNAEALDPEHGTLCRQIFMAISAKTWAVNREKGHPGLVSGRATHARRLEIVADSKWATVLRDFVPVWTCSADPRDRAGADSIRYASGAPWRERGRLITMCVAAGCFKWYSKSNPGGLRYVGDGGPMEGGTQRLGAAEPMPATVTPPETPDADPEHGLNLREWWEQYEYGGWSVADTSEDG